MRAAVLLLAILFPLSGCGTIAESSLNPFNWFGQQEEPAPATLVPVEEAAADPRPLIEAVTGARLERRPGGSVLIARGLPPTQGWWAPALIPADAPAGVLSFAFRAAPPLEEAPAGTERSREITVAVFLSDDDLEGIGRIEVTGATAGVALRP